METNRAPAIGPPLSEALRAAATRLNTDPADRAGLLAVLTAFAEAATTIADLVRRPTGTAVSPASASDLFRRALAGAQLHAAPATPTALVAAAGNALVLAGGPFVIAIDPLAGASGLVGGGTLASTLSVRRVRPGDDPASATGQPGRQQVAAAAVVYGAQMVLLVTLGQGTDRYLHDPATGTFVQIEAGVRAPEGGPLVLVDTLMLRDGPRAMRVAIEARLRAASGVRLAVPETPAAAVLRLLATGGVALYPTGEDGDGRGTAGGLDLVTVAAPLALLLEQAGGQASDGVRSILDRTPATPDERIPALFGSAADVARLAADLRDPAGGRVRSPLFRDRSLFEA